MKTQKENRQGLYLRPSNNRWKWMAGATAATAAGVTASQVSAITINLVNNYISVFGSNYLNADLTGDGHPDLTIANVATGYRRPYSAMVSLNGVQADVQFVDTGLPFILTAFLRLGSRRAAWYRYYTGGIYTYSGTRTLIGSIPIFFKDLHINGGAPTRGSLEVAVSPLYITLDSFTYNTPVKLSGRTVPDQGSSLALLAMGAGGVLALRRWRAKKSSNPPLPRNP